MLFMPADQSARYTFFDIRRLNLYFFCFLQRGFCIWQHNCKAALKRILRTSELLLLFTFQGFQWVNGFTVNQNTQVQVRASCPAGVAGFRNDLSLTDFCSGVHQKF